MKGEAAGSGTSGSEMEDDVDAFLGKTALASLEEGGEELDTRGLTVINHEIAQEFHGLSHEWLEAEIKRLGKEADELEIKLNSGMSLRERAEYDMHVPFSLREFDEREVMIIADYLSRVNALRNMEEDLKENGEAWDEEAQEFWREECTISPELEAAY